MTNSAQSPEPRRVLALDGLRGFACLLILLFHYISWPLWVRHDTLAGYVKLLFSMGWCGVDLFFVLSGFLLGSLCLTHSDSPHYLKTFFIRRALRILPLYFVVLGAGSLVLWGLFQGPEYGWIQRPETPLWPFWVYLQNFYMVYQGKLGPYWLSGTWSLAVEEHFYLLLPFFVRRFSRTRYFPHAVLGLIVASLLLRWVLWALLESDGLANYVLTFCRWDSLFIGVLGAWMVRQPSLEAALLRHQGRMWVGVLALGVVVSTLAYPGIEAYEESLRVFMYSLFGLLFLLLLLLTRSTARLRRLFERKALVSLGRISYGVYLLHPLVFGLVSTAIIGGKPFFRSLSSLWISALCLAVTVGLSWLLYVFVERPLLIFGRRWRY